MAWWGWPQPSSGADPDQGSPASAELAEEGVEALIDDLWRMDANGDGLLEANEIPEAPRDAIKHWVNLAKLDPSIRLSLAALEDAIRDAYGKSEPSPPSPLSWPTAPAAGAESGVPGFGPVDGLEPIPGFGEGGTGSVVVEKADLDMAASWLQQFDRNRDGSLDRGEARRLGGGGGDPFQFDSDRNDRLNQRELAKLRAEQRAGEAAAAASRRQPGPGGGRQAGQPLDPRERERQQQAERQEAQRQAQAARILAERGTSDAQSWAFSAVMLNRYDINRNGSLSRAETEAISGQAAEADADGNGDVDRRELAEWLTRVAGTTSDDLPRELPRWFRERDADGNHEIAMAEFVDEWTTEKAEEFMAYDLNQDGLLTVEECLGRASRLQGAHQSDRLQVIPIGATIYSEIVVEDEEPVSDLNVQISITHASDGQLDIFLIDPQGKQVELCTGVGGGNDHFDNTIFDDEAKTSITEGRPPFNGAFRPEGVDRKQPSLKQFYGKSIAGTWTLMIRAERSGTMGALHGWSLIVKRDDARQP